MCLLLQKATVHETESLGGGFNYIVSSSPDCSVLFQALDLQRAPDISPPTSNRTTCPPPC